MRMVTVAATQMACGTDIDINIARAEALVRQAADQGAQIILIQELFEYLYFCQIETPEYFALATSMDKNPAVQHFKALAKELQVVLPISFFERHNQAFYNTVVIIDADGGLLGHYRKTHIPDGPGYEEKYYFNPGDIGFKVWNTRFGSIGVGICWDQWFPESARCMALMGAEILLYPTAIGSEPINHGNDTQPHWQLCMQGHAAANLMPVIASNRIGKERVGDSEITFYGSSFITDNKGEILQIADRNSQCVLVAEFDLDAYAVERTAWGVFRDRRPSQYGALRTKDGSTIC